MELHIEPRKISADARFIRLEGSIDSWTSEDFRDQMFQEIDGGTRFLLLRMNEVKYISSQGIGALFELIKKIKSVDGYFAILDPHLAVRRALEIVKMQDYFVTSEKLTADNPFFVLVQNYEKERAEKEERNKTPD